MTSVYGTIVECSSRGTARISLHLLSSAAVILLSLCGIGCGDQFRPVALPIPRPSPSPAPAHFVASLSSNGPQNPGAISRIDVSGGTVSSVFTTGIAPVHAAWLPNGTKLYVANSGEDTISASSSTSATAVTTISLPQLCDASGCAASVPVFVNTTENTKMYVANSGNGTVAVINATSDVVLAEAPVNPAFAGNPLPAPDRAANPVALAELPNAQKVYSVNRGNSTVTSISTVDDTVLTVIPVSAPPIWAVASSDSADLYVLDTSGTISVIDTLADAVVSTASAGAGANFMFLETVTNRLYVTNPAAATVSIFDVAGRTLTAHAGSPVAIAVALGSACTSAAMPTSVNALADGSRAYVASFQADANGNICTQATVINSGSGLVTSIIPLSVSTDMSGQSGCSSARFRVFAASSPASGVNARVYVSQCDAGSVAIIDTFASTSGTDQHPADVMEGTVPAPVSSFPAPVPGQTPPLQNPVFVAAGS